MYRSKGIERTRELAQGYCDTAKAAIEIFPDSEARAGLEEVLKMVVSRTK